MRVLHVFKTYYPDTVGGVEQVIKQLCLATAPLGVSNRVFTLSRKAKQYPLMQEDATPVVRAQTHLEFASTPISYSALKQFRAEVAQADLIHYHYPWPFGDVLHRLAGYKKPALATYHSDIVRQRAWLPLYRPLQDWFLKQMRAIVATSPNYLQSSKPLQTYRDKVSVIPIGIDENSYPVPSAPTLKNCEENLGKDFFLFIGALRYYKGLHILLKACADNAQQIVIAGAGPMEKALKAQAAHLNLKNIHFLGLVSDEEKAALLTLCRAVVFPSHLRSEAFGITLLEGAMFGKPLISSEIGTGSSYINIHEQTGLVIPPNDAPALRAALARLASNDALVHTMGKNARARFEELFTAQQMAQSYAALYRRISERHQME